MVSKCQSPKNYGPDTKTCQKAYKFDLKVKGQHRMGIMNVHDTLSYSETPMCQIWYANVNPKKIMGRTRKHVKKTCKSDFKRQRLIGIMNVRDTSSW